MDEIEKMGRLYTDTLKKLCGENYDKVQAASRMAEHEFSGLPFPARRLRKTTDEFQKIPGTLALD